MEPDTLDENYLWASLEEIRTEDLMRCGGGCNCSPDGDGPPCPHGHCEYIAQKRTEAEWAKEALKDWVYEEEEEEEEEVEYPEEDDDIEQPTTGIINLAAQEFKSNPHESDEPKEWVFNDATQEWEEK